MSAGNGAANGATAEAENATATLARFVTGLRYEVLPPQAVTKVRQLVLDALGCAIGAWREEPRKAGIAAGVAGAFPAGAQQAWVIGGPACHPAAAALANGMLINATDNDDTHKRALAHLGSVLLPSALAAAQSHNLDGRALIAAIVAGYEVASRVGMAVMPTHYRFWHSTATNGTFGAAAAVANAWRLDTARTRNALGLAGTQAAGLNTFFESGDDSKSVHPGKAAMNGMLAALLAAEGATAPPDILGHPKGYLAAYSLEPKADVLIDGLGERWEVLNNGFKPYPSILASHSPIGASLAIARSEDFDVSRVRSVEVRTYATVKSHFSSKSVETEMAARLSVPYCVAVALSDGTVDQAQFSPARLADPELRALLQNVEIVADPDLTALYPEKFPARVIVTMDDGRQVEEMFMYPKGDPANPLSDEELEAKFRRNLQGVVDEAETTRLLEVVGALERHGALDLRVRRIDNATGARDV